MEPRKESIITALQRWIAQRPGLEFGNYGEWPAYRSEMRSITKDLHHARLLLQAVQWRDSITADDLIAAAKRAYSGRLEIREMINGTIRIEYCTGQYWPTEYRRAVCAILAYALWDHRRESLNANTDDRPARSLGDEIRTSFKREFGHSVASRWFS